MKNKKAVIIATIIGICCILVLFYIKSHQCTRVGCIHMDNLDTYKLSEVYEESKNIFRGMLKNQENFLRVEVRSNITQDDAEQYINAGIARMKGLYLDAPAPYAGVISDAITCAKQYKPTFSTITTDEGVQISYFTGYLNNQLIFGACDKSEIKYKGVIAFFYCSHNRQSYQLELFTKYELFEKSPQKYSRMIQSIKCNY